MIRSYPNRLEFKNECYLSGGRTYLVGEGVILVGDQQDGGKKRQISTPVSAFSAGDTGKF
jgi:hypothetical protein